MKKSMNLVLVIVILLSLLLLMTIVNSTLNLRNSEKHFITGEASFIEFLLNPFLVAGDLFIEILVPPEAVWEWIIWPEGVYEPTNVSRIGTYKSLINITFVGLNASSGDLLECVALLSDGSFMSINQLIGGNYVSANVSLLHNLQVGDDVNKTSPWHIVNCTLYGNRGAVIYSTSEYYNDYLTGVNNVYKCLKQKQSVLINMEINQSGSGTDIN